MLPSVFHFWRKALSTWFWERVMGVSNTVQMMLSKQGGVVRDPSYLKKWLRFSGSMERTSMLVIFMDWPVGGGGGNTNFSKSSEEKMGAHETHLHTWFSPGLQWNHCSTCSQNVHPRNKENSMKHGNENFKPPECDRKKNVSSWNCFRSIKNYNSQSPKPQVSSIDTKRSLCSSFQGLGDIQI